MSPTANAPVGSDLPAAEPAALAAAKAVGAAEVVRFDGTERFVHWTTAAMMLVLIFTGSVLYIPELALTFGHRSIMEWIHVITGIALLVPLAVGVAGPWRGRLVADLRRFDRWSRSDFDWFRRPRRRRGLPNGKFNGGQKLEAAFLGSAMVATLVTGLMMRFAPSSWVNWQYGATLVHDTLYVAILVAVGAHIFYALSRPDQMSSMLRGKIPRSWAAKHAPVWLEELDGTSPSTSGGGAERPRPVQPRRK